MPCAQHAFGKNLLPFAQRLGLTRMAVEPLGRVSVTDVESRMTPPNYTVDTLERLRCENPGVKFSLVVGADVLNERHKWKRWDVLEAEYGFHILGRAGYEVPQGYGASIELPEISSTHLRACLERGDLDACVGHMNLAVLDAIARECLYGVCSDSASRWLAARGLS